MILGSLQERSEEHTSELQSRHNISYAVFCLRGATPPRLILELVAGKITIAQGDSSDTGLIARVERLERQSGFEVVSAAPKSLNKEVRTEAKATERAAQKAPAKSDTTQDSPAKSERAPASADIAALRRMWPDVIESVKRKRRLTWSLLSASAQILSIDNEQITIGIVNAGARDSFIRSESEAILVDAFVEVTGIKRKIEVVVDSSTAATIRAQELMKILMMRFASLEQSS